MQSRFPVLLALLSGATSPQDTTPSREPSAARPAKPPAMALLNGMWFDGTGFEARTVYTAGGHFTMKAPDVIDRTIDLDGGYVVPPFGEAHNHNITDGAFDVVRSNLDRGIFYVKNPNSLPRQTTTIRDTVNRPTSLDVVFSGPGLTSSGGHPIQLVDRNIRAGNWTAADGEGAFYFTIDDSEDVDRKWPAILANEPDFLKTYLLYSEEYEARRSDPSAYGWRGLAPELLTALVERAHAAGLRVSSHVETATDFHHAVHAGVDEVNHLPGFRPQDAYEAEDYLIAEEDARAAGARGMFVVTTIGGLLQAAGSVPMDHPERAEVDAALAMLVSNIDRLVEHGVRVAIGSDAYEGSALEEALALHALDVFEPALLLRMWCENTAFTIFPDRAIGRLEEGYEASFLVLRGNPLEDFGQVQDIAMRVKQGFDLDEYR